MTEGTKDGEEINLPYRSFSKHKCRYTPIQVVEPNFPTLECGLDLPTHEIEYERVE